MIHFLLNVRTNFTMQWGEFRGKSSAYLLSINWFTDILYLDLCLIFRHWCPDLSFYLWIVQVLAFIPALWGKDCALYMLVSPEPSSETQTLIWALLTHAWWLVLKLPATCGQSLACHILSSCQSLTETFDSKGLSACAVVCCLLWCLSCLLILLLVACMEPTHGLQLVLSH